jgi:putative membrane protein insertion efficiency factor
MMARSPISGALVLVAKAWQAGPSAMMGPTCRYTPSCSAYAIEAWTRYGAARGTWLAARRIGRCHPLGGHGYDPVP